MNKVLKGDALTVLKTLPSESINCTMTSPPYWGLRDYGVEGQLGLEKTFEEYIDKLCNIFDEVKRVTRNDGTCWVNLGDTYNNSTNGGKLASDKSGLCSGKGRNPKLDNSVFVIRDKQCLPTKSLCLIPQRFAIEMLNRGWICRNVIIWHKPNCMPSSAKDRFTVDFEYLYFFSKSKKYYFEQQFDFHKPKLMRYGKRNSKSLDGVDDRNAGLDKYKGVYSDNRNKRTVWKIPTRPFTEAHFAVFPEALIETPIQAGCPKGGIVLDPFMGAGTTAVVAKKQGKKYLGIELKDEYIKIANKRIDVIPESLFV